jgi:hypothetical protein
VRWHRAAQHLVPQPAALAPRQAAAALQAALAAVQGELSHQEALQLVCEATRWPVGHMWVSSRSGWHSSGAWFDAGPQFAPMRSATESTDLGGGRGIVAAVLHLESCRFLPGLDGLGSSARIEPAKAAGLRSVIGVPVHATGPQSTGAGSHRPVAAVLEFCCATEIEPDGALAQALLDVARRVRLGRVAPAPRAARERLPEAG